MGNGYGYQNSGLWLATAPIHPILHVFIFSDASKYSVEKKQYFFTTSFFSQRVNMPNSCLLMGYHFATNKNMYEKCVPGLLRSGCKANWFNNNSRGEEKKPHRLKPMKFIMCHFLRPGSIISKSLVEKLQKIWPCKVKPRAHYALLFIRQKGVSTIYNVSPASLYGWVITLYFEFIIANICNVQSKQWLCNLLMHFLDICKKILHAVPMMIHMFSWEEQKTMDAKSWVGWVSNSLCSQAIKF